MDNTIILNFGDSQGEIWDYVFYNNSNYITYQDNKNVGWRSGWSTRGLKKYEHQKRLFDEIPKLAKKNKRIIITLTFGSTDIEWNLSYKRFINKEFPDVEIFINQMKDNLLDVINKYLELQNKIKGLDLQIIVCFPYIPLPLSNEYMKKFAFRTNSIYYQVINHNERIELWNRFCNKIINSISSNQNYNKKIHIFDLRKTFLDKGFNYFSRKDFEDHHPDLSISHLEITKILDDYIFYDNNNISFYLNYKNWQFDFMYPHLRRPFK